MASELVKSATSDKLKEMDWAKNIEICEVAAHDKGQARDVIKAIKKRLESKHPNTQLFAVMLLEMLMNNCGEHIHQQLIDTGILPILVKIVKKKSDLPVREKIFLLLDATQTSLGGASGRFPQYYAAYYELVCARVQFPQRTPPVPPDHASTKSNADNLPVREPVREPNPLSHGSVAQKPSSHVIPDSSVIQKASTGMEILREVLNALDPQNPEGATDEFTLDLVEQCSFQKQRLMHLVMTCRDEKLVSQAIELNDQLDKLLARHDALLSVHTTSMTNIVDREDEVEEPDQLFRRLRKGKACINDQPENYPDSRGSVNQEMLHRPLIRPLCLEPPSQLNGSSPPAAVAIPPPPAKHVEREKYFKEKKVESTTLAGHMRRLSLNSNGSSSQSGSIEFSE